MDWTGKKVLVVGCGISGIGSTELLEKVGASPVLFDENTKVRLTRQSRPELQTVRSDSVRLRAHLSFSVSPRPLL